MAEQSDPSAKEPDRAGRAESGRRPEAKTESGRTSESAKDDRQQVNLAGLASLERLRDRVEVAAHEMKRLRDENRALAERIKELETRPAVDPHGTFLSLDHDPELLKRKIAGFIEAIDHYLERERKST